MLPLPGSAYPVTESAMRVGRSTFKGGLDDAVHRWFRLTPSFGPALVGAMADRFLPDGLGTVLDPFGGAATTLIECKKRGLTSVGYEINPFLHFVGKTCLDWSLDPDKFVAALLRTHARYHAARDAAGAATAEQLGLELPRIFNVHRWWRADVLRDLLLLRQAIRDEPDPQARDALLLALSSALVPDLTNVTLGRLQLHFIDRSEDDIAIWPAFSRRAHAIVADLRALPGGSPPATLLHVDALQAPVPDRPDIDLVVTSPPYPNRYSYVWNTRPHLYFLGFFGGRSDGSQLDKRTIGGTWGAATTHLKKGEVTIEHPGVRALLAPLVAELRGKDNLMANYLAKYFDMLSKQIVRMVPRLKPGASVVYVVGNSRLKGVYVPTDTLLADAMGRLGLRTVAVERFRRRHSGKDLYESAVIAAAR